MHHVEISQVTHGWSNLLFYEYQTPADLKLPDVVLTLSQRYMYPTPTDQLLLNVGTTQACYVYLGQGKEILNSFHLVAHMKLMAGV